MEPQCRICYHRKNQSLYQTREMFFGFRDTFQYFQCEQCECLQITEVPANIAHYYPSDYYSHDRLPTDQLNVLIGLAKDMKEQHGIEGLDFIKQVLIPANLLASIPSLCKTSIGIDSKILDVGCGEGMLLYILANIGFEHTLGIDPFIKGNLHYSNGLKVLKQAIFELEQTFDLIMFHHSFEHMEYPFQILEKVKQLLNPGGQCLLRIPICSSYAWEHYREDWVNLDPPRHFYLYSHKSLAILFEQSGFEIIQSDYDSTDFQFWGSEQYKQDIPLMAENSYFQYPDKANFTSQDILHFKSKASQLNREKRGDYLVLWLKVS